MAIKSRFINLLLMMIFCAFDFFTIFAPANGELAQLARALDWQSKGQGFDSPILHTPRILLLKLI